MREISITFDTDVCLAGALCLPEDCSPTRTAPAMVLLGGSGGDTRDGDMAPQRSPGVVNPPKRGLMRRIAHHLAHHGIATVRFDKRGCGESGGSAAEFDYDTDLEDNKAAFRFLQGVEGVDPLRVGVAGHSAGAFNACLVCRDVPEVACAGLLGALYDSIEELMRWNWGRVVAYWDHFSEEQRHWLREHRPKDVACAFNTEAILAAVRRGDETVSVFAQGVQFEIPTRRLRQDMFRPVAEEFRHVRCPALVLHGGADMNVKVEDALNTYQALKDAGNEHVEMIILPGLDHSFQSVSTDPLQRAWDRVSLMSFDKPVSQRALENISRWTVRVLCGGEYSRTKEKDTW